MKLLVTGGAGFIGSNFVHYWLKNHPEDEIIVFDLLTYAGHIQSLKDVLDGLDKMSGDEQGDAISSISGKNIQFIRGDITDASFVAI
ncbi:GDP-mannose 4,6-dehydratase, partial [Candidatus Daviesbacteria bacterium]|nr:GDP-mannose 4,6-dehydratase [Candidatus Daviesbacteria bacterium]